MSTITYRAATAADLELVAEMYLQFSIKMHKVENTPLTETQPEDYFDMARENLDTPLITTILAFDGKKVVGFADWFDIPVKKVSTLDDLFVLDEYAGQGIGSMLMKMFEDETSQKGYSMRLEVYEWNTHAREVYKHRGYKEDGIVMVKD